MSVSPTFFVIFGAGVCNLTIPIRHKNGKKIMYGAMKKCLVNDLDNIYKDMNTYNVR